MKEKPEKTSFTESLSDIANIAAKRLELLCARFDEKYYLTAILVLSAILRISRAYFSPILNVDSAVYLFQAKSFYCGEWQAINSCVLKSVSLHPIFSSLLYSVTHDWIVSMVATSILFGTLTTIPIYYTARIYFPLNVSLIIALIYSVMHVFVTAGVDISRDTPFWFFSASGIYFFSAGLKKGKNLFFPLASVFFLLAAWNRIEAIMFLAASPLYLMLKKTDRKSFKIISYFAPIMFGIAVIFLMQSLEFRLIHKFGEIPDMLLNTLKSYQSLRADLLSIINAKPAGFELEFFKQVRTLLWMLGINIVVNSIAQSFLYIYLIFFFLGLFDFKKWREQSDAQYFGILIAGAFVILYAFVLTFWFLENRYTTLLILPSFIFIGFGIERVISLSQIYLKINESVAVCILVCVVLAFALPAQVRLEDRNKEVFKQIGSKIAQLENGSESTDIFVVGAYFRTLHLYSNLKSTGLSCPDDLQCNSKFGINYPEFVSAVDRCKAQYVVWEEKYWPAKFDLIKEYDRNDFLLIGEWFYKETGRIVVLKRLKAI